MESIISVDGLKGIFDNPDLVILDASQDGSKSGLSTDYPDIQIKGARFFDLKNVFSDQKNKIPNMLQTPEEFSLACRKLGIGKSSTIVVYDNLGIYTSPRVWWMFKTMGHQQIAVLDGGLPAWIKMGFPTEKFTEKGDFVEGDFTAVPNPEMVRNVSEILENIEKKVEVVIDARGKGRFDGTTPEPREGMKSGHIPNSLNLPFKKVLEDGKFLPKNELEKLIKPLNLKDQPLVFSCGSGVTACIIMMACAQVLDNKISVYDGSWSEWGMKEGLPIEKSE